MKIWVNGHEWAKRQAGYIVLASVRAVDLPVYSHTAALTDSVILMAGCPVVLVALLVA